jgi:hypothetical protein
MTSKVRAGLRGWELEPSSGPGEREMDPELEAEVALVQRRFEALSPELRAYLDQEARTGREAYTWP